MGEHNYQNPSYYKLNKDDIEEITYELHNEFLVRCVDILDKEIVILRAIKNELERMKEYL